MSTMDLLDSSKKKFITIYHSGKFIIDLQVYIYIAHIKSYRFEKFKSAFCISLIINFLRKKFFDEIFLMKFFHLQILKNYRCLKWSPFKTIVKKWFEEISN